MASFITLAEGSGGKEMQDLIASFKFPRGAWASCDDDAAALALGDGRQLLFTTDSFVVDPLFFPGGDIGKLAVCGTLNDLAVMGGEPLGLSLAIIIEEGFPAQMLAAIVASAARAAQECGVAVATGDTKVMERGKIDKLVINTAGVGIAAKGDLLTKPIAAGDKIILSGGIGEHAVALLSKRFEYETAIVSDCASIKNEIAAVKGMIKIAKDPTRGGIASILNELCEKHKVGMLIDEELIPLKPEVRKVAQMFGINPYELASEGRFLCVATSEQAVGVVERLKRFHPDAAMIGEVTPGGKVIIATFLGKRVLPAPRGRIVPRIC